MIKLCKNDDYLDIHLDDREFSIKLDENPHCVVENLIQFLRLPYEYTERRKRADLAFLTEAYSIAKNSNDPSTQNGVILVKGDTIVGRGYNQFPIGVRETTERWTDKATKYKLVVHAETAAILDAASSGRPTKGTTMYGCWVACLDCARDIIQAGIVELVGHHHKAMDERPDWNKGIEEAFQLLREAGVKVRTVEGEIGQSIRFAGKEIAV